MRADVVFAGIAVGGVVGALILSAVLDRRDARQAERAKTEAARATTTKSARHLPIRHVAAGVASDQGDQGDQGSETQPAQHSVVVATETVEELPPNAPGTFCPHCFYLTKAAWPTIEPAWHLQPRMCEQHLAGHELVGGGDGERHQRRTKVTVLVHRLRRLRVDPYHEPRCIWN